MQLFATTNIRSLRKRVGLAIRKFGTVVINNIALLRELDLDLNLDKLLNLNHHLPLPLTIQKNPQIYRWIFQTYSLTRAFKLLTKRVSNEILQDCYRIVSQQEYLEEVPAFIRQQAGNKPQSIEAIHRVLAPELYQSYLTQQQAEEFAQVELEQDILFLNRKKIGQFTIQVPKIGQDLIATGKQLHHCVEQYIVAVIARRSQIFNLYRGSLLSYTVELRGTANNYTIKQIKGYLNNAHLEEKQGKALRAELIHLINSK
jgi:hypothetical protein